MPHTRYIPRTNDVREIQEGFYRIWTEVEEFTHGDVVNFHGRRIGNAGDAVAAKDYVTKAQMERSLGGGGGAGRAGADLWVDAGSYIKLDDPGKGVLIGTTTLTPTGIGNLVVANPGGVAQILLQSGASSAALFQMYRGTASRYKIQQAASTTTTGDGTSLITHVNATGETSITNSAGTGGIALTVADEGVSANNNQLRLKAQTSFTAGIDLQVNATTKGGLTASASAVTFYFDPSGSPTGFRAEATKSELVVASTVYVSTTATNLTLSVHAIPATNNTYDLGTSAPLRWRKLYVVDVDAGTDVKAAAFKVGSNQVVGGRVTGWTAPTGTATRSGFATGTVTLSVLAEHVKALLDDLTTHGLIGA